MSTSLSTALPAQGRPLAEPAMLQGERKAEAPAAKANSSSTLAAGIACIVLVAIDLRPGIVSVGPLLGQIRNDFGISNAQASLLTAIPNILMGLLALPTPWLARRFGRDRVILAALTTLSIATLLRPFVQTTTQLLVTTASFGLTAFVSECIVRDLFGGQDGEGKGGRPENKHWRGY